MSIKYFCDVCNKEALPEKRILLMSSRIKIRTLCLSCWIKAEKVLTNPTKPTSNQMNI